MLAHPRPVVRKRAIITLSQYIPISQTTLVSELLAINVFPFLAPNANIEKQRTTVQLIAALTRQSPSHVSPYIGDVVPGVLKSVSRDDDELRDGCLQVRVV